MRHMSRINFAFLLSRHSDNTPSQVNLIARASVRRGIKSDCRHNLFLGGIESRVRKTIVVWYGVSVPVLLVGPDGGEHNAKDGHIVI